MRRPDRQLPDELTDDLVGRRRFLAGMGLAGAAGAAIMLPGTAMAQTTDDPAAGTRECHNVRDYGAVGDGDADDSDAFGSALDAIAAAGAGVLYVPTGDYRFASRVTKSVSQWYLTIVGDGQGVSNLYCDNADGILQLTSAEKFSQITIHDLSLYADRPHAGTALEISQPVGGNNHYRNLVMRNVEMRGVTAPEDYFDYGLRALGQWRPLLSNVISAGPYRGGVNQERDEDSLLYAPTCGIQVDGSYAPSFENCYIWSAYTGCSVVADYAPAPEGTFFYNCFIVGVRIGIDCRVGAADDPEPGLAIDRCHVNARDVSIRLRKKYFSVTNCLLYNSLKDTDPAEAPLHTDIQLQNCAAGLISHNILHQPTNDQRIGVEVLGDSFDIAIRNNYFNHRGTGVYVGPDASNVVCTHNRFNTGADPITGFPRLSVLIDDHSDKAIVVADEARGATVSRSTAQPVPDSASTTAQWESQDSDTGDFWSADAPDRFVIPAKRGIRFVRLIANVAWEEDSHGWREVELLRNGEAFVGGGKASMYNGVADPPTDEPSVQNVQSAVVAVDDGDELTVQVRQTSGATLSLKPGANTWFSIEAIDG